jgi:uncharacterized protein (TIGR02145 family)
MSRNFIKLFSITIFTSWFLLACKNEKSKEPVVTIPKPIIPIDTNLAKDYEGHSYATVDIGNQKWISENLRTSYFINGDRIEEAKTKKEWFAFFLNKKPCFKKDGKNYLYNGYVISDPRGLLTGNYKIPSLNDFNSLRKYLGKSADKSMASYSWEEITWDTESEELEGITMKGTNKSGFNAQESKYIHATLNDQPLAQQINNINESEEPSLAWFWTKTASKITTCTGYTGPGFKTIMVGKLDAFVCDDPSEGPAAYACGFQVRLLKPLNNAKKK